MLQFRARERAFIFLDEGGNLDFSIKGTKYFTLTSVVKYRPFIISSLLDNHHLDIIQQGIQIERFHASEDRQQIRDIIFHTLNQNISAIEIDSIIVEKRKTRPPLQTFEKFYPFMLGSLLQHVFKRISNSDVKEVIIITDSLPVKKKKELSEKIIKSTLKDMLPPDIPFKVMHFDGRSITGLQIVDYLNWAIYRFWERNDDRSLKLINPSIKSMLNIFENCEQYFY